MIASSTIRRLLAAAGIAGLVVVPDVAQAGDNVDIYTSRVQFLEALSRAQPIDLATAAGSPLTTSEGVAFIGVGSASAPTMVQPMAPGLFGLAPYIGITSDPTSYSGIRIGLPAGTRAIGFDYAYEPGNAVGGNARILGTLFGAPIFSDVVATSGGSGFFGAVINTEYAVLDVTDFTSAELEGPFTSAAVANIVVGEALPLTTVPEPLTLTLLGSGLAAMAAARRRRRA